MPVLLPWPNERNSVTKPMAAKADETAQAICSNGGAAIAVSGDITDNEAINNLVHRAAEFGHGKIHIIVNNAGYAWDDPIEKIQDTQWGKSCSSPLKISNLFLTAKDTIVSLHSTAPFKLIRAAAPYFMVQDGEPRCIVNISSTSGVYGNAGQASYALAKAGIIGLTKTIAQEWGPQYGVRANSMHLSFFCPIPEPC
jgi:3-oxoacyl-[acyl-carrier protein] reductase